MRGAWEYQNAVYEDNLTRFLTRFFVDVPDVPEHRAFFREFKERLKSRFNQLEIWVTSYPLDVI